MFWGLTPALDLLKEYELINEETPEEMNILIIGGSDCRHVLQTIAKKYRHKPVKLNFYLLDACLESIGRQLLLLYIALQPQESMGLDQKTKTFMELYGNTLVRPSVAKSLSIIASDLVEMITNYDYLHEILNCISFDMKYKERDYLENLLKFWVGKDEFNICDCWDRRLRKMLGVRYDAKYGAFDWDLHMRFHEVGGKQVCNQEYRNFRLNGVAFSWLENEVSKPNRTFVCAVIPNGDKFAHYGYLGDIQTGPFVAYGLDCDDKEFLKSTHGQNSYRATDVTERNLKQVFYEIQNKEEYDHKSTSDMKMGPVVMKQEKLVIDTKPVDFIPKKTQQCFSLDDKICFMSTFNLNSIKHKEKYSNFFHLIYFSNTYLKYFERETIEKISKNNCLLIIEHQLYVLSNRKKELEELAKTINKTVSDMNVKKKPFDCEKDAYAKFVIIKTE
ncbi:unnamed protein product [Acanthoscelides obtectus]|uniref:Dynein assembly factor 3, axonemal n=1 Tax=Acanthoscelides obtectus TaxID=200917 RepID=A0A9P0L501_ACAOB|nr:unnamed protein product [Acanthoscelides obtectus]CAK1623448.1 Dynein assembly factor 3, axonemal homolog [Acanthoscelides obtectus]